MHYIRRFIFSASSDFTLDVTWLYILLVNFECNSFPFLYFVYPCKQILHPVCSFLGYEKESPQTYNSGEQRGRALAQLHLDPRYILSFPDQNLPFIYIVPHRTSHTFTFVCCSTPEWGKCIYYTNEDFKKYMCVYCLIRYWNLNYCFIFVLMTLSFLVVLLVWNSFVLGTAVCWSRELQLLL